MRPDFLKSLEQPASGDALSLFTNESDGARPESEPAFAASPARIPGAVSIAQIVDAAPLRFVEGIAVVQALCGAVKEKGGVNAGMPSLAGVFLREGGDIVAMTPPGSEPAAPELARLLHRLVPADATPPVARLFVDRWTSGDSADLTAFASEIAYFARPNGRELLTGLYARCAPTQSIQTRPNQATTAIPVAPIQRRGEVREIKAEEGERPAPPKAVVSWLQSHKRHIFAAAVLVALAVTTTGLVTWFWPSKVAQAAHAAASIANGPTTSTVEETATSGETGDRSLSAPVAKPRASSRPKVSPRGVSSNSAAAVLPERSPQDRTEQLSVPPSVPDKTPTSDLSARGLPDMRIYSAADPGIEPPRLQSTEILEGLISGFPTKTNSVEVLVDTAGKVERVRMQGPPQRIPDIMLLSRVKEWVFAPATRDGVAVRYRMVLSWDVTP
jgi:hypothetical protein